MKYETTGGDIHEHWINNLPSIYNPTQNWPGLSFPLSPLAQPMGWQCPICGTVYAPTIMTCFKKHRKPRKPKADGEAS